MPEQEVLMSVSIDARRRNIELTSLHRGKGRHTHYASIKQAPPALRGEALTLIREAILAAGYASLAELETALTAELVVPQKESPAAPSEAGATRAEVESTEPAAEVPAPAKPSRKRAARKPAG